MSVHVPVLLREVLSLLDPQPGEIMVDGTFGAGGHSLALAQRVAPTGRVIGIEWDPLAVAAAPSHPNLSVVHGSYRDLSKIIATYDLRSGQIDGVLLDLGLSSDQLAQRDRGFSVESEEFLDLRFDQGSDRPTAADLLARLDEQELTQIFRDYSDEPLARPIARAIVTERRHGSRLETAAMLVQLVSSVYRRHFRGRSRHHPATRVFQALRVAVNDEFGNIRNVLPQALDLLAPGGRLAVISFHSGEDRLVKDWLRAEARADEPRLKLLTRKPLVASETEERDNPRSRSAKLRGAIKIA